MPRPALAFLLLTVLALAALPVATSADTPSGEYPGVYVIEGSSPPKTAQQRMSLEMKCALAPSTMDAEGKGSGLMLDRDAFLATGRISYIKGHDYQCRYDPATKIETCSSTDYVGGMTVPYNPTNAYQIFTEDLQSGYTLWDEEAVERWKATGGFDPSSSFAYHRCNCLDVGKIDPLISPKLNTMATGETNWRLFRHQRDPTAEEHDLGRKVLDALKACADVKGS